MDRAFLYRTIWRWHFYAGLFVIPMILMLALTGATFLFKPQVDAWEERAWQAMPTTPAVTPDAQVQAALSAVPGGRVQSYRVPAQAGDAALIHIALPGPGRGMRDVFVSPQGQVVGMLDPERRIMAVVQRLHGQLLLGKSGSWLVELAASWAIVMILTGLYLWWPRGRGAAGVIWPRLGLGPRAAWRDLHAVTGFWVAGLALVLLVTGLPWADAWGSAFKAVRTELGWVKGAQDWTIGGRAPGDEDEHAGHDHTAMAAGMMAGDHIMNGQLMHAMSGVSFNRMVAIARSEHLPFPVLVSPPGAERGPGSKAGGSWTVRSDTQNRPLRVTIRYSAQTGHEIDRETFADKHPIDRAVAYGVAWHEGQLLGWVNQLVGVMTALLLVLLAVSGFVLWRRRRPAGRLGAPPASRVAGSRPGWVVAIAIGCALLLPLLALSLVAVLLLDGLVLPRWPRLAAWLGLPGTERPA